MNCRKANSLLSAYIDGELTGTEQIQVRHHLRACCACESEHHSLEQTKRILARLATRNPNPELEDRILRRISEEAVGGSRFDLRGWWGLLGEPDRAALRSGAMFLVVALAALIYILQPARTPDVRLEQMAAGKSYVPRSEIDSRLPIRDMLGIHSVGGSAQPASAGMIPVSNMPEGSVP